MRLNRDGRQERGNGGPLILEFTEIITKMQKATTMFIFNIVNKGSPHLQSCIARIHGQTGRPTLARFGPAP
jgi:hypothetical protein